MADFPRIHDVRRALSATLPAGREPAAERTAAVAAILRQGDAGLEVLFIRRAEREGDPWSGHMAFPGGRRAVHDVDLLATAIRETTEEVGLDLSRCAELVGVLEDQEATGRGTLLVLPTRPFVFELIGDPVFTCNHEVTETLWTPVEPLYAGARQTTINVAHKGQDYALPGWDVQGRIVWGLTYRMLSTLLSMLEKTP